MRSVDHSPATWRKSTYSGPSNGCVEVARVATAGAGIGIRDSKDVAGSPVLRFKSEEWRSFLGNIKSGRLDLT
jgi:uncharacterized protein DUF397